ncbi:hypothetical protein [Iningainema tapete]|uniref:Uncharacterized protein n=1 Tax=Iningainema tapete BLCC-T55 TaxID=2748662 RepID=A0A8J7CFG0_9CYAN|nr:hypothetical protein [Iningainema tapete]MBD2774840.1 hypothetical protein [Iningainema tapete BLCC-T55]
MSLSALAKFLLPPVMASAAVFSVMSAPLFVLGAEQINIKFKEEPFFSGKLRDVATPYVVLATAISMGAGLSAIAMCGWRNSAQKSTEFEQQLSVLEKNLQEKEELIKELKLSETRLQASGLSSFLNDEMLQVNSKVHKPAVSHETTPVTAASTFSSAQNYLGFAQASTNGTKEVATTNVEQTTVTMSEFEHLQTQLRDMMLQMQIMHNNLLQKTPATNTEVEAPERLRVFYESYKTNEVHMI